MPLSKANNRDRMREYRLHSTKQKDSVQPKAYIIIENKKYEVPELDADGNIMPRIT